MNAQNARHSSSSTYATLREVNDRLRELELAQINAAQCTSLLAIRSRDRVVDALGQADRNPNAMAWLRQALTEAIARDATRGEAVPSANGGSSASAQAPRVRSLPPPRHAPPVVAAPHLAPRALGASASNGDAEPESGTTIVPLVAPDTRQAFHAYGQAAAIEFRRGMSGKPGDRDRRLRIFVDGAKARDGQAAGTRSFNWDAKLTLMLDEEEALALLSVVRGLTNRVEYGNHGPQSNKYFSAEFQAERRSIFFKLGEGSAQMIAVPIGAADAFELGLFLIDYLREFYAKYRMITTADIDAMLASAFVPMLSPKVTSPRAQRSESRN